MGCSSCSKKKSSSTLVSSNDIDPPQNGIDFTLLEPKALQIRSNLGQFYSILSPLVKMLPPNGWGIPVKVKNHTHLVSGSSGREVVEGIVSLFKSNNIEISSNAVWFNANLFWLDGVSPRHAYTTAHSLKELGVPTKDPLIWDKAKWKEIELVVDAEIFSESAFTEEVGRIVNLASDPQLGCETCYDYLISNRPSVYDDQEVAREWLKNAQTQIVR
jgi:hypothetical protein